MTLGSGESSRSSGTTFGVSVFGSDLAATAELARAADEAGLDTAWTSEFYYRSATVSLAAMAQATRRCRLGSSIMYGVGRTPLVLATEARDLDELCGGRLVLGLGNGTRRMLSDWHGIDPSSPAVRMEELVVLLRKLWRLHEGRVRHEGRFYNLDIVPAGEVPPPLREALPVYTAGVNPRMIEVAGRVSNGLVGHPLFSRRYVEEVVRPAIARGAALRDRDPREVEVLSMVICAIHEDEERARREAAGQIAFYASVGTYARPLEESGFAREAEAIRAAFRQHDLAGMTAAVSDEMVDELAVAGTPAQVRSGLRRYEGVLDHVMAYSPSIGLAPDRVNENIRSLIEAASAAGRRSSAASGLATP